MRSVFNKLWNRNYNLIFFVLDGLLGFSVSMGCKLRGISIGRGCKFYGLPRLVRSNESIIQIGKNCQFRSRSTSNLIGIRNPCILSTHLAGAKLIIGNSCGFSGTVIGSFMEVSIGNNVRCGANTVITDSDWHPDDPRTGEMKPVIIGDNVWLGYGVIVLKGVTIGENSLIGAGSVVVSDIPKNVMAAGNPCKVIKHFNHE